MKKIVLITSIDYELFGDGSGNVAREQIDPTYKLIQIASTHGVKMTIMFEYGQYQAYEKFGEKNKKLLEDNEKIRNQLVSLIKNGHDVQLHYHAQWNEAIYDTQTKDFTLNMQHVDISTLEYETIVQRLKEGKSFLEKLLQPFSPDYKCIGFRAGSWAVKNQKKLLDALVEAKLLSDSSVVPNVKFESEQVNFKYKDCPHQYHYWYSDTELSKSGNTKKILEIPIYTKKTMFAYFRYLNNKYLVSRKIVSKIYKTKISEKNFSLWQKIKKTLTRNYYMADLNTMSYKTLMQMIEEVIYSSEFSNEKIIPVMMICHSKTSYEIDDLNLFYANLKDKHKETVEFWTYQKAIDYLGNNQHKATNQDVLKYIKSEDDIPKEFTIPILGQEKYLKTKSDNYGWLLNDSYIISFFIDTRLIFKRLVFSIGVVSKNVHYFKQSEADFLNDVVDYIREHKVCDFIAKAQANVLFSSCPSKSTCVPWGTYEVDLHKSDDELFSSFNGKSRNAIRRAIKDNVNVEKCDDISLIFNNIKETLQRQNSIHYPSYEYIEYIHNTLKENSLLLVSKKNLVVQGSLIVLYDEFKGYAMYAGSVQKPTLGSIDLLHFEAMKYLKSKNVQVYDFVGTRLHIKKGSKQEGIDKFKRKFNPTLKEGCAFRVVVNPAKYFFYNLFSKLYLSFKGYNYTDPISEIKNEEKKSLNRLLLMGPHYTKSNPQMVGGPIVLFEDLLSELDYNRISYKVIDTNKRNYKSSCHAYISIFVQFFKYFYKSTYISLHSSRDYMIFGPLVILFGKIFSKKTSLRKFGGEASRTCKNAHVIKKYFLKTIFKNFDALYMETKYLVEFFLDINKNTYWFPNVRKRKLKPELPRKFTKKFVFISHVIKTKGISEIIDAAKQLDKSYTIDVYGPMMHGHYDEIDFQDTNVRYQGVLEAKDVLLKLNEYDVVLLPSYKEGYPGIIIEAYSLGMPVISTSLPSIKEIVIEKETGLLVEPKNVNELAEAIKYFDKENYTHMSQKAYKKFDEFKSDIVTKKFIDRVLV